MRILLLALCWPAFASAAEPGFPGDPRPQLVPSTSLPPAAESRRDALTRYGVGLLRDRADQLASAAKQYQAAADRDSTAAAPLRELARVYADLGRDPAAIRAARKALELDPHDAETARRLGNLLADARQFGDSGKAFRQAAESPVWKDRPALRLAAFRDAARSFHDAADHAAVDLACRDALSVIRTQREALLRPDGYDSVELERIRAGLHETMGQAQLGLGKFDAAAAAYETASAIFADRAAANSPTAAARLQWNLSGIAMARGDTTAALKHLESFLRLRPSTMEPYQRYIDLLRQAGRAEEIERTLNKLASANPTNTNIAWLSAAEKARTDFELADAAFRKLAATLSDPDGFTVLVRTYVEARRASELLDLADKLFVASQPMNPDAAEPGAAAPPAAIARARLLTNAIKEDAKAGPLLVRQLATELRDGVVRPGAIDQAASTSELVTWLAIRDNQIDALLDGYRVAIRKRPSKSIYQLTLHLLRMQRKWPEMAVVARQAREGAGFRTDLFPYRAEAIAQAELLNDKKALDAIDFVIKNVVAEGKLSARMERVRLLNILGRHLDAVAECADIRQEFKTPAAERQVRLSLADAFNSTKEYAKAEAELRALLEEDPDDILVLNNLGYNLADQGRLLPEAEAMIRRAIELDRFDARRVGRIEPESGVYLDSLAWVLFRRGKLAEAKSLLEKAVTLSDSGPDPVVWDHLGDVRFRLGEKAAARQAWTRAAEFYQDSHQARQGGRLDEVKKKLKLVE